MAEKIICCFFLRPHFPGEYPVRPDEAFCAAAAEEHDGDLGRRAGRVRRKDPVQHFRAANKEGHMQLQYAPKSDACSLRHSVSYQRILCLYRVAHIQFGSVTHCIPGAEKSQAGKAGGFGALKHNPALKGEILLRGAVYSKARSSFREFLLFCRCIPSQASFLPGGYFRPGQSP